MALLAGLTVSTVVLLRTSGAHVRRAEAEAWLAGRMAKVAVFELQGIVSFGVAALVVDQVRQHLAGHQCVIFDASRVPSWDETGYARLRTLAHDLHDQGMAEPARLALERGMLSQRYPAGALIVRSGDQDRRLMLVQEGEITLSTAELSGQGLRLASMGRFQQLVRRASRSRTRLHEGAGAPGHSPPGDDIARAAGRHGVIFNSPQD